MLTYLILQDVTSTIKELQDRVTTLEAKQKEPTKRAEEKKDDSDCENVNSRILGILQEYCVKNSLPAPIYDLQKTSGPPHSRSFEVMVKVGNLSSCGIGSSQKNAQRIAATQVFDKITALGSSVSSVAGAANKIVTLITPQVDLQLEEIFMNEIRYILKASLLSIFLSFSQHLFLSFLFHSMKIS